MSKSAEQTIKDYLAESLAATKAMSEKVETLASEGNTYTERMKKMEDNLTSAMSKVLEMDASIKDFHKLMQGKLGDLEKKYAESIPVKDEESAEGEMTESPDQEKAESKKQEKEDKKKLKKKEQDPALEKQEEAVGQDLDNDEEEGESKEHKDKVMGKKADNDAEATGMAQEPHSDTKAEEANSIEGVNKSFNSVEKAITMGKKKKSPLPEKKAVENTIIKKDGDMELSEPVNKKYDEEKEKKAEETVEKVAKEAVPAPVASEIPVDKMAEALNAKIESLSQKLASDSVAKAQASEELTAKLALEVKAKEDAMNHFKALNEKFEALMAKVGSLEKSASTVETKAAQIVSKQAIEAPLNISAESTEAPVSDEDNFKKFEAMAGKEQRSFYLANKQSIERHASSLLRAKRS